MIPLATLTAGLLATAAAADTFPLPCRLVDSELPSCAVRRGDRIQVPKAALTKMDFSPDGLAQAFIEHSWYYIKRDGSTLSVVTFDNGADYFSEGLVRSRINGKIGYFDKQFKQMIPPRYDWAWPFKRGKAVVCIGCVEAPADGSEHRMVAGGRWGYIDHHGHEIVSVTHSSEKILEMERR